jgi:arabinogalactan oligomer/maltooligosaccharide transport system permease protein
MLLINGIVALLVLLVFLAVYFWNIKDAYNTGKSIDDTHTYLSSRDYGKNLYRKMFPYIVLSPVALILIFIVLMPIIFSILTAFTNYNNSHLPPATLVKWVGFQNFAKIFSVPIWSQTFLVVLSWTIIWAICATFSTYFMGLFQALLINSKCVKHKSFFQAIYILPWAIPGMISLLMFRNLLNGQFGPLNQFLIDIHLIHDRIPFLADPVIAKITIIVVNLWMGFPAFMIMLLGVLSSQDPTLYEAAEIDGANKFQTFYRIKLPLLMKATAPLVIMNLAGNFNAFSSIYFLTSGGPTNPSYQFAGDTDILISWIYKMTLNQRMYNMAAVMNILIFIFIGAVSFWNFRKTTSFKEM